MLLEQAKRPAFFTGMARVLGATLCMSFYTGCAGGAGDDVREPGEHEESPSFDEYVAGG